MQYNNGVSIFNISYDIVFTIMYIFFKLNNIQNKLFFSFLYIKRILLC